MMADDPDDMHDKLERIRQWCDAYPEDIFLEPDFKKVAILLNAGGISLDAVSASYMRRTLKRLKEIIDG